MENDDLFQDPQRIEALCEDYRAGAGIDRQRDATDRDAGRKIRAPLHLVYAQDGFPAATGDPLSLWRRWAEQVTGEAVDAGHFAQEECPAATAAAFVRFFAETTA
ncbi:MAG: hypothetical protein ACFCBW_00405 [Candidatus Competibacterales bacterium]